MLSEVSFRKEANSPWGFRLTGGPQFGMPLTVFQVEDGGRAYKAGIRLGDVLIRINGMEADQLSLEDAHNMIREAGNNINLSISNLEDQELRENEELAKAVALNFTDQEDTDTEVSHEIHKSDLSVDDTSEIQHSEISVEDSEQLPTETSVNDTSNIVKSDQSMEEVTEDSSMPKVSSVKSLGVSESAAEGEELFKEDKIVEEDEHYVDVNSLPLLPPRPLPEPERAQRKCWHPVMLDTNPPPIIEESTGDEEYPHKKMLRNIRKAIQDKKVKATPETLIFFLCNKFAVSEEKKNKISM